MSLCRALYHLSRSRISQSWLQHSLSASNQSWVESRRQDLLIIQEAQDANQRVYTKQDYLFLVETRVGSGRKSSPTKTMSAKRRSCSLHLMFGQSTRQTPCPKPRTLSIASAKSASPEIKITTPFRPCLAMASIARMIAPSSPDGSLVSLASVHWTT